MKDGSDLLLSSRETWSAHLNRSGIFSLQILKQEEDIRSRTSTASDAFRKEVLSTQAMRQEYFNLQLPRILRVSGSQHDRVDVWSFLELTLFDYFPLDLILLFAVSERKC